MYEELGMLLYVAMSADASCKGLTNARDGPIKFEMVKGERALLVTVLSSSSSCGGTSTCANSVIIVASLYD